MARGEVIFGGISEGRGSGRSPRSWVSSLRHTPGMNQDDPLSDRLQVGAHIAVLMAVLLVPLMCCGGLFANWLWNN